MTTSYRESLVVGIALVALVASARAESVPSFSLDYADEYATHVIVVNADGVVLESWRGDLAKGDKLPYKADKKPLEVVNPFPREPRDPDVASVTGDRRVLFLIRKKQGDAWIPAGYLKPEEQFATVWIEKGQCFAVYQFINPGRGAMMHPLYIDEQRLKEKVLTPKELEAVPLPAKTPFDADVAQQRKRADYLHCYRRGYAWAKGMHLYCPTNPDAGNLHAVRGWIEGWQAGVKAGGQGDLPAKYAPYVIWRGEGRE